jgi:hypothetical protein
MRNLFSSISIFLSCTALGTGEMGAIEGVVAEGLFSNTSGSISELQHLPNAGAESQICMTEVGLCERGCDLDYAAGAAACAMHGFTAQAAICHAANSAVYGACLAGCR